ncbi:hypothetical protein T439DRAFT_348142 [Meredithblackwellia eburnea MCA 4105]
MGGSTIINHTVPPFYACYLLKSNNSKRSATYIGSTPDPPRRIKQHNGIVTGGAFKTRFGRPWEMEMIVWGFPTKLQALQFEWAWQNPHKSRHLHSLTTHALQPTTKPTAQFPRTTASNRPGTKVLVAQFMLVVPPWKSFNLRVTVFSEECRGWWEMGRRMGPVMRTEAGLRKWEKERVRRGEEGQDAWGRVMGEELDRVVVDFRYEGVDGARLARNGKGEEKDKIAANDVEFVDQHWSKWEKLSSESTIMTCSQCSETIDHSDHLSFLLCTSPAPCQATFHLPCLASHFISLSAPAPAPTPAPANLATDAHPSQALLPLLPTLGHCPSCAEEVHWQDLIRGSYRRWEEVSGKRKKKVSGKGKGRGRKKVSLSAPTSDDDGSVGEEEGEGEVDGEEEQEQERSWALMAAAEGALDGGEDEEEDAFQRDWEDEGEENEGVLFYAPTQAPPPTSTSSSNFPSKSKSTHQTMSSKSRLTSSFTSGKKDSAKPRGATSVGGPSQPTSLRKEAVRHPPSVPSPDIKAKRKPKPAVAYIEISD